MIVAEMFSDLGLHEDPALARFAGLTSKLIEKRNKMGDVSIKDPQKFIRELALLSKNYGKLRLEYEKKEAARSRFLKVAKATKQLYLALSEVAEEEHKILRDHLSQTLRNLSELNEEETMERFHLLHEVDYKEPETWRLEHDLRFMFYSAQALSTKNTKAGRPLKQIELVIAQKFVVLCHRHGWSSITVANSNSPSKKGKESEESLSLQFLKLIFKLVGSKEISLAKTCLTNIRKNWFEHREYFNDNSVDSKYIEDNFNTFKVNLNEMRPWWVDLKL